MSLLNPGWIGFFDRTYDQIKSNILLKFPAIPEITDLSETNPWVKGVSVWSAIAEGLGYYIDSHAREFYVTQAQEFSSGVKSAKLFDYRVRGPVAASVTLREIRRTEGRVPLPEADIVVSAGRGMKDASNWGIIEELAKVLGATTACSRPVADSGWRPHYEHVGQTGLAIQPNLYIAIGISGAIQHLAGVNNSKVIVVINKDPEAPFFKAADYGVCGDLFEVVPRLTEALHKAGM